MIKVNDWMKVIIYGIHMNESRGKKHDCLIMDLELSVDGEVGVTMMDFLKKIVSGFPDKIQ